MVFDYCRNATCCLIAFFVDEKKMKHEKLEEVRPAGKNLRDKDYEKEYIDVAIGKHIDHASLTFNVYRAVKETFNKAVRTQHRLHRTEA